MSIGWKWKGEKIYSIPRIADLESCTGYSLERSITGVLVYKLLVHKPENGSYLFGLKVECAGKEHAISVGSHKCLENLIESVSSSLSSSGCVEAAVRLLISE